MTDGHRDHLKRAAQTYGSAADHFSRPALGFWDRFGSATVARLNLARGDRVLDLCCGAGASAIPAARLVGPSGTVLGVDIAAPLLELARARASSEGVANVDFHLGDATATGHSSGSFDTVVCVFGVFFVADMPAFVSEMWRLVAPGGTLAITTWGPGVFEPGDTLFWERVREVEPALFKSFNPWDEITTVGALQDLFASAGVPGATAELVEGEQRFSEPAEFWDVVLGTGYRASVDALSPPQRRALRTDLLRDLRKRDVRRIRTDVIYGTARR